MKKSDVLKSMQFGNSVAEQEVDVLKQCFVYTRNWERLLNGDVDVVYGPKGSGKSALYTLLNDREDELFARGVILRSAENPRGSTVFSDLQTDPPVGERHFVGLWKLYILTIVGEYFQGYYSGDPDSKTVLNALIDSKLLSETNSLKALFAQTRRYITKYFNPASMEPNVSISEAGSVEGVGFKISFSDPDEKLKRMGVKGIDELLAAADRALRRSGFEVWVLFDRLDVAFAESADLERNALLALFRVYLDFQVFDKIKVKLFVRTDIWTRITKSGFREATHIKKELTIEWDRDTFLNLIIRRFLNNSGFNEFYKVEKEAVLKDMKLQEALFYRVFPEKIDSGKNPNTLEWIVGRTADGHEESAPRDIINLINSAIDLQCRRLEIDHAFMNEECLFERGVVKEALTHASVEKIEKHLFAEYPQYRGTFDKLRSGKAEYSIQSLAKRLGISDAEAEQLGKELTELRFFITENAKEGVTYWVPFIYRDGLDIRQGVAE